MEVQARKVAGVGYTYQVGPLPPMCLEARLLECPLVPEVERVEMGVFRCGVQVGRFPVRQEICQSIEAGFQGPVSLVLSVVENKDTVRATLFALLPRPGGREPWREDDDSSGTVGVPIARARRLPVERRFPASLPHEAGDLLTALLRGEESLMEDRSLRVLGL